MTGGRRYARVAQVSWDGFTRLPWRPVLVSFVVARLLIALGFVASHLVTGPVRRADLLGWDAAWYLDIAQHGYAGIAVEGRRFFPVLPGIARGLGWPLGGDLGAALVLQSNVAALGYALLVHRVALSAGFSRAVADRLPWIVALSPAGFVLVMGYAEGVFGILVCTVLLAVRSRRWWPVIVAGLVAGALRPTGIVLTLPILLEALRGVREAGAGERLRRATAVLAPAAGMAAYLVWSWRTFGDLLGPLTAQTVPGLRGGLTVNPLGTVAHGVSSLFAGDLREAAPLVHLCWVVAAVTVLVLARPVLPTSWWAFAVATVLLGMTARNFNSFERYAASAVPLLIGVAWLLQHRRLRRASMVVAPLAVVGYSFTTFLHAYIP
ncbi:hypothetical protein [Nakamurella deserti]|uniref:hypothetical protein n=1 Tax=Nakamurella deserti TaxID=2164074 RepID=UPI0013003F66|nr:hypothetical protein [Nakamurella deserti]